MEKHGFVVLADIGIIRRTYLECMRLLKGFFEEPSESKEACKGTVHFNERGIPMVRVSTFNLSLTCAVIVRYSI